MPSFGVEKNVERGKKELYRHAQLFHHTVKKKGPDDRPRSS
jgi:hypothetical protein